MRVLESTIQSKEIRTRSRLLCSRHGLGGRHHLELRQRTRHGQSSAEARLGPLALYDAFANTSSVVKWARKFIILLRVFDYIHVVSYYRTVLVSSHEPSRRKCEQ